ncbi:MAG: AGE family epimerase/isomerase [Anaerolineae bacterium]|nr:AGE family epimerase/isomerase [Anaerolineae bacterium]
MRIDARFVDLLAIYRAELLERVVPFWLEHAIDRQHGGILTCIADDSTVLSTDKYMWSQLRAIWTFSALYNRVERRQEWLDAAWHIYDFVKRCGRDEEGRWVYAVDEEGRVLQGATSIYTDGFAIYGLTELARATGEQEAVDLALETCRSVQRRLATPGSYGIAPYELPEGAKAHAVSMIFALVFHELGRFLGDETIIEAGLRHAAEVMDVFLRPERRLLYEFVGLDGSLLPTPQGRAIVPGHAIESMWFMIHIYGQTGDEARIHRAIEAIRWHLEFGWDEEYGGLFHARDAEGGQARWPYPEAKLWWPHTETLVALLMAYEHSREVWCLEWFERVHNYAFSHFPVAGHGEWTQKLDRRGRKLTEVVALPVKDPFHLPRALILCTDVLQRLSDLPV